MSWLASSPFTPPHSAHSSHQIRFDARKYFLMVMWTFAPFQLLDLELWCDQNQGRNSAKTMLFLSYSNRKNLSSNTITQHTNVFWWLVAVWTTVLRYIKLLLSDSANELIPCRKPEPQPHPQVVITGPAEYSRMLLWLARLVGWVGIWLSPPLLLRSQVSKCVHAFWTQACVWQPCEKFTGEDGLVACQHIRHSLGFISFILYLFFGFGCRLISVLWHRAVSVSRTIWKNINTYHWLTYSTAWILLLILWLLLLLLLNPGPWLTFLQITPVRSSELSWQRCLAQLRDIEKMMSRVMMREQFVHRCVPIQKDADVFAAWGAKLAGLRWEVITKFTGEEPGLNWGLEFTQWWIGDWWLVTGTSI